MPEMFDRDVVEHALASTDVGAWEYCIEVMQATQKMKTVGDAQSMCDCDPAAYHSAHCKATPLFTETIYTLLDRPGYVDPMPEGPGVTMTAWHDMRWVCHGGAARSVDFHTGGSVNFFAAGHWCPVVDRWLEFW